MTREAADIPIKVPDWLVRLCKWYWRSRGFLFGTVLLSIILNIVAALPLIDRSTLHAPLPIAWLAAHWSLLFAIFIFLLLLTVLCGLIARLSAPLSKRELYKRYLEQVTRDTELATLKGIPAGLISESVRLADIYIPPRFYANRTRVDFPISEEELEHYRQSLKRGQLVPHLERIVFEAEKNWHHILKKGDQVALDIVWQQLNEQHAVVIQGYPGMGKSTLMERLTLHIAARSLRQQDSTMPAHKQLTPTLIPILLRLSSYARALADKDKTSLSEYLCHTLDNMNLPGLTAFIQQKLQDGACLVMLDGLDEVSEPERRELVQREIKNLISGNYHACRFIITSRVAGYDQAAFPAYPHFMLAELGEKEIDYFLPRWCRVNLDREHALRATKMSDADISRVAERRTQELKAIIQGNQGVRELAKNPLLLTLLLVMQQNSIVLPQQRVELYETVTKTLLENRNIAKGLEKVSEFKAIERLGPLAFQMQQADSELVHQREVEEKLIEVIREKEGGAEEDVRKEAQRFLQQVRERGGLFVSRVSDYFGFMHRTFQEYFAARYILNNIKTNQQLWIDKLVQLARHEDALWREPFLLAVAYQSKENERIASEILRALLAEANSNSFEQELSIVLLAADAIIEAEPLTLTPELQKETAERLLACYEKAQCVRDPATWKKIEDITQRWLYSLPKEAYRLPLLDVISQAIQDTQQVARQHAVLILLATIGKRLEQCPEQVFEHIIPLLLAIANLPTVGPYSPTADLATSANVDVIDLALSVLSFLGKRGPAGLYLETVRNYFAKRPELLHLLARYSLECRILITPAMIPQAGKNYSLYKTSIKRWLELQEHTQGQSTAQDIAACINIQQSLLACAEEVSYPTTQYLLAMLERSKAHAEQPWSEVWQDYLLEWLNSGNYINYKSAALLWNILFSKHQLQPLVHSIMEHYTSSDLVSKRYAQRLLSFLSSYLRDLIYSGGFIDRIDLRELRDLSDLNYLIDLSNSVFSSYLTYSIHSSYLSYSIYSRDLRDLSGLIDLSDLLITRETTEIACMSLLASKKAEKIDLLRIIQGRIRQLRVNNIYGSEVETEVQFLVQAVQQELALPDVDEEVQRAMLGVLAALPARTAAEIALIWKLLDETQDEQLQEVYAYVLQYAQPFDQPARQELEKGENSCVEVVRNAVKQAMEKANRKEEQRLTRRKKGRRR